jgi:thiol-disulfide isomerase/thioredoxin
LNQALNCVPQPRPFDFSRRAVLAGLTSFLSSPAELAHADQTDDNPPLFQTNVSQFILFDPPLAVPAIRLQRIDGKLIDLASFRGKSVLVNFWATWCPPCQRELPLLDELQGVERSGRLEIVAVAVDKDARGTAVQSFVKRLKLTRLRPYLDPAGEIAKSVGEEGPAPFILYGLPVTNIINRGGHVAGYLVGEADWMSTARRTLLRYLRHVDFGERRTQTLQISVPHISACPANPCARFSRHSTLANRRGTR